MTKELHTTDPLLAQKLVAMLKIRKGASVLDAGSGNRKVFYNAIPGDCISYECEIEDGKDFFTITDHYNWVIGNPPFHESYRWFLHAADIAETGIAFLINNQAMNSMTVPRYQYLKDKGFTLKTMHITGDKRWFGRYYWLIFTKDGSDFVSW